MRHQKTSQRTTPENKERRGDVKHNKSPKKRRSGGRKAGVGGAERVGGGGRNEDWKRRASEEGTNAKENLLTQKKGFGSHFGSGQDFLLPFFLFSL